MEGATFQSRETYAGWWRYDFSREDGSYFSIAYAHPEEVTADLSFASAIRDFFDQPVEVSASVPLGGRPLICERPGDGSAS